MKENKKLQINGTMLEKEQLKKHLEKIASSHNIINKSQKDTYPVPELIKDYEIIKEVYKFCRNSKWGICRICKNICVS